MDRRDFLKASALLSGAVLGQGCLPSKLSSLLPRSTLRAHAKSFVFLTMYGGPSQMETFDYKPELYKSHGKKIDFMLSEYGQLGGEILKPRFSFKQYGQSGAWVSEIFPGMAQLVDEIAILKSCRCQSKNHGVALAELNSGQTLTGYPTLGSWITYALPSLNPKLPAHFVFVDSRGAPQNGEVNWTKGFLPDYTAPTPIISLNVPIPFLSEQTNTDDQTLMLQYLQELNVQHAKMAGEDQLFQTRTDGFNMAMDMHGGMAKVFNVQNESEKTKKSYGLDNPVTKEFGKQLLITRRLLEAGVRSVQIYHGGNNNNMNWDQHQDMIYHKTRAEETDLPILTFMSDLKSRGLLDETVVLWGGEFGRLAVADLRPEFGGNTTKMGRQHNEKAYTMWMAGAGIKKGISYGQSDDLAYEVVENPIGPQDLQATILYLLGVDYKTLKCLDGKSTYLFSTEERNIVYPILNV